MSRAQSLAKQGKNNPMYGRRSVNWKGGKKIHDGYYLIWMPNHPFAQKNGYITEHRFVMEQVMGRYLYLNEIVHHINGNRLDNRVENLEIVDRATHASYHNTGLIRSLETRQKISNAKRGQTSWMKGKTHTLKAKVKMSELAKKRNINRNNLGRIVGWTI